MELELFLNWLTDGVDHDKEVVHRATRRLFRVVRGRQLPVQDRHLLVAVFTVVCKYVLDDHPSSLECAQLGFISLAELNRLELHVLSSLEWEVGSFLCESGEHGASPDLNSLLYL